MDLSGGVIDTTGRSQQPRLANQIEDQVDVVHGKVMNHVRVRRPRRAHAESPHGEGHSITGHARVQQLAEKLHDGIEALDVAYKEGCPRRGHDIDERLRFSQVCRNGFLDESRDVVLEQHFDDLGVRVRRGCDDGSVREPSARGPASDQ